MNNVPNLRFSSFNDGWRGLVLDSICTINPKTGAVPDEFYYIDLESVQKGIVLNIQIMNKKNAPSRAQRLLAAGDILFQTVRPYQQNNYFFKKENVIPTVASTGYAQIRAYESNKFLYYLLHTSKFNKNVLIRCTGSNYPAINSTDLSEIDIWVPSMKEQEKIASFLSLIDRKIELQTEKVEELKNYKKGIMQKIFSQELRFKDENGNEYPEWEEKKLGNFIVEYKEKTTVENQYPVLTSSRSGLMFQTDYFKDRQVTTQDNIGYHIIPRGYITFRSRSDDTTFKFNQNNLIDKGIISYFYPVFCFNESLNDMYALYFMNNYLGCQIRREIVGTSQLVLSLNKLKELKIPVPCIEEQNKIGKLLDNLENKILQEQNKLNHFNRYKKGLLQQMFI